MNQLNRSESINKSASANPKPSSPTYNGYARFKVTVPPLPSSSAFVRPPHMQDPSYLAHHANKPDVADKVIALNDLEEGVKLAVLSDVERDQRIQSFQKVIKDLENKRKQDHEMFDRFIKKAKSDQSELEEKYGSKCLELLKLQKEHQQLNEKFVDATIEINGFKYKENDLRTLLAMKNRDIEDLKETVALFKPNSPPNLDAMMAIMDPPHLDLNSNTANANDEMNFAEEEYNYLQMEQRNYLKKQTKSVTDPDTLDAIKYMLDNIQTYSRLPFYGTEINGLRYAFYFGKINKGGAIGMSTNIVLSSDKKVFNVSNIEDVVEMNWNQDVTQRGKKRGYGHIYIGTLTGGKGFEANILNVFQTEVGVIL